MDKYYCLKTLYFTDEKNMPTCLSLNKSNNVAFKEGIYYKRNYRWKNGYLYLNTEYGYTIIEDEWRQYFLDKIQLRRYKIKNLAYNEKS